MDRGGAHIIVVVVILLSVAFLLFALSSCAPTKTTPMPGNGAPDGTIYRQTGDQCRAQPDSVWCRANFSHSQERGPSPR